MYKLYFVPLKMEGLKMLILHDRIVAATPFQKQKRNNIQVPHILACDQM